MNKLPRMFTVVNTNDDNMELRGSNDMNYHELLNWYAKQEHKLNLDRFNEDVKKFHIIAYYYNSHRGMTNHKYYISYDSYHNKYIIDDKEPLSPYQPYFYDKLDAEEALNNPYFRDIYDRVYCAPMECPFE